MVEWAICGISSLWILAEVEACVLTAIRQIQSEKPSPHVESLFSHHHNALVFINKKILMRYTLPSLLFTAGINTSCNSLACQESYCQVNNVLKGRVFRLRLLKGDDFKLRLHLFLCCWLGTLCLQLWEGEWGQQGLQILLSGAVQGVGLLSSWLMAWK